MADEIDVESMTEKTTTTKEQVRVEEEGSSRRRRKRAIRQDPMAVSIERLGDSMESVMRSSTASNVDDIYVELDKMTDLARANSQKS